MAPAHAPPTKIISSTPLSPAQAHAFLSSFTTAAEASKNDAHNGHNEIVLTNLKRIEQALIGIHVPRPVQGDMDIEGLTDMAAPLVDHFFPVEGEGEEQDGEEREEQKWQEREESDENNIDALDHRRDEGQNGSIPAAQTVAMKKADKKARRKEEKKHRAEQRMKEKEAEDTVADDSE